MSEFCHRIDEEKHFWLTKDVAYTVAWPEGYVKGNIRKSELLLEKEKKWFM